MKKHESRLSRDILLEQMRRLACAKVNDAVKLAYLPEEERESIGRLDLAALTEFRRSGAGTHSARGCMGPAEFGNAGLSP